MPLVINSLSGEHTHTCTLTDIADKSDFKKLATGQRSPGITTLLQLSKLKG